MKAKFSFSNELLSELKAVATRRRAANIEKYNRANPPETKIDDDHVVCPTSFLEEALAGYSEPVPSRWGMVPGCVRLESERLYIHAYGIIPNETDGHCQLYVATLKDTSITPRVIVTMIATMHGGTIQWLETAAEYRRQGYALEFLQALEGYCGYLDGHAATEDGERFLLAYDRALKSKNSSDADSPRRDRDRFDLARLRRDRRCGANRSADSQ